MSKVSFSRHYKQALDSSYQRKHRISHLRSCAVHVSSKYGMHRDEILNLIGLQAQYRNQDLPTDSQIEKFAAALKRVKDEGLSSL